MTHRMTRRRWALMLLAALLLVAPRAWAQSATCRFRSGQDVSWDIPFDQSAFERPGTQYNQALARSSLGMALSAFRQPDVGLQSQGGNIRAYLEALGFEQLSLHQYHIPPSIHTIASAVGMKTVTKEGQAPYTVLAVAVSGGGYGAEWKSNFTIGTGLHHEGFDGAAKQVVEHVQTYLKEHGTVGALKVWMSGYSRAAATSNRAAAMLLDRKLVGKENLYAYTFATPNVTRQQNAESYPSIFNIVSAFDPVPMVPFSDWGFRRYGQTYYLPSPETNSDYARRVVPVNAVYRRMLGVDYWQNLSSNRTLLNSLSMLAGAVSNTESYASSFQPLLVSLWDKKDNPVGLLTGTVQALWKNSALRQHMGGMANNFVTLLANAVNENLHQSMGFYQNPWKQEAGLKGNLMLEHYPQGYLAWMLAYDHLDAMKSDQLHFRQVLVNAEADIRLKDRAGRQVLSYRSALAGDKQQRTSQLLSQTGDALVLTVPTDENYLVEVSLAFPGSLDLVVREGTVGHTHMRSFTAGGIQAQPGTVYSLELNAHSPQGTDYLLTWPQGSLPLVPGQEQQLFSTLEQNSSASEFLRQSLFLTLALLVMLVTQALVHGALFARARHGRRKYKALQIEKRRRLWKKDGGAARNAMKTAAVLTALSALYMTMLAVMHTVTWLQSAQTGGQRLMLWIVIMSAAPSALMVLLNSMAGLAAGLLAILWRDGDFSGLRTCRATALWVLPFSAVLLYLHMEAMLDMPWTPLLMGTLVLMAGLLAQTVFSHRLVRAAKKAQRTACQTPQDMQA